MKKRGFTLAEVLVTLGIIAVAAAALGPLYMKMRPDKYKSRVLKYYTLIDQTTSRLLDNEQIYYRLDDDGNHYINNTHILDPNTQYGCNGLFCTSQPKSGTGYNNAKYQGNIKYPNLMADELPLNNITYATASTGNATGTLADQSSWTIQRTTDSSSGTTVTVYDITIDLDSSTDGPNCSYSANCKRPDRFMFRVDLNGDVSGQDSLTRTYIKNITNIDKSEDFTEASGL